MNATAEVQTHTLILDDTKVSFHEGETIYEVAQRAGREVPTLC